ncbi:MAG TPA: hypothetical protein PLK15_02760, partial [Chitinophagales bacterium]|nr:hypothetical protein [Chitinophagales bacterium]
NNTAGIEKGTNQKNIFQLMYFRNTTILDAELVNVPMVSAKGTTDACSSTLSSGNNIKLAPPPHIALIQKANMVDINNRLILNNIRIVLFPS